jgi:hypothetical protein
MDTKKISRCFLFSLFMILTPSVYAEAYVSAELSQLWQSRNDQRVPGNTGTQFSIASFNKGPFTGYRIYAGYIFDKRHEIRALYAPLELEVSGQFHQPVNFQGTNFNASTDTKAFYKFNSYRLTYAYHYDEWNQWFLALGFSAKIRDAEVRLSQGGLSASKSNVGFVPLLNFQARRQLAETWQFRFDFDGLAAPQGRAIDAGFFLDYKIEKTSLFGGYRTVEGGADNDTVYNFAWFHQAVLGLNYTF